MERRLIAASFGPAGQRANILTIEGLGSADRLHPLQQAFVNHFAIQCGFCTRNDYAAKALLDEVPMPPSRT